MAPGVIWTKEECEKLNRLVEHHGKKWTPISSMVGGGKTGKQCRRQWERLNIVTKQCGWSPDEDELLLEYHYRHGNKWTRIARLIGGRTDNAVKNRYHALRMKNKAPRLRPECILDPNGHRSLKSISSLERRVQMRKELEQARFNARNEGSEGSSSIFVKGEPSQSTGHLSSSFGNAWGLPSCSHEPWIHGSSDMQCPSPFHLPQMGCYSGMHDDGGQTGFLMGSRGMHNHQQQPSMIPGKVSEDADSMESTSENKTPTTRMDCLATYYPCTSEMCCTTTMAGTSSNPLPSRVLDGRNPVVESLDRLYKKEDRPIPCTSLSMDAMQPQTMKMPELTVELPMVDFDFDSCLNTVSPSSPSFYCKFLNLKSSPVTMMTTAHPAAADQEAQMEA